MIIWYSSMITEMQLQQSWSDDASTLQNIMIENKDAENELFLDINEQLTWIIIQHDEL